MRRRRPVEGHAVKRNFWKLLEVLEILYVARRAVPLAPKQAVQATEASCCIAKELGVKLEI